MKSFKQFLLEFAPTEDAIHAFADKVKDELGLNKFDLWVSSKNPKVIGLRYIIIGKDKQAEGTGTKAMNMLCKYADEHGLKILLSPSDKDSRLGTTSKSRLVDFYKRFGFVENKGKLKDFAFMDSMYRNPKIK